MDRYTLQIGPGEPDMVKCEGGAWVRWEDVDGAVQRAEHLAHHLDELTARWQRLHARQYRLNVVQFWGALFFSALFAVMFFIEGKPVHAVVCGIWTVMALFLSLRAWPLQQPEKL